MRFVSTVPAFNDTVLYVVAVSDVSTVGRASAEHSLGTSAEHSLGTSGDTSASTLSAFFFVFGAFLFVLDVGIDAVTIEMLVLVVEAADVSVGGGVVEATEGEGLVESIRLAGTGGIESVAGCITAEGIGEEEWGAV